MAEYLNLIQIISGVIAAALVFAGIFLSAKKLNPEKYVAVPVKTTVISTCLVVGGLLIYAITKTCTNLTVVTEEHYELATIYLVSLGEVFKMFGFICFVPLVFRLMKPKSHKNDEESDIIDEDCSEESAED